MSCRKDICLVYIRTQTRTKTPKSSSEQNRRQGPFQHPRRVEPQQIYAPLHLGSQHISTLETSHPVLFEAGLLLLCLHRETKFTTYSRQTRDVSLGKFQIYLLLAWFVSKRRSCFFSMRTFPSLASDSRHTRDILSALLSCLH